MVRLVSLNEVDQVGFDATGSSPFSQYIYRGDGTTLTEIARTGGDNDFDFFYARATLNDVGVAAFIGETDTDFVDGVYVGDGGAVTPLYDENSRIPDFFGTPIINNLGEDAILLGNGGPLITVADSAATSVSLMPQR